MAMITMSDGSTLDLTESELALYLRSTAPAPKSAAERAIEKMAELRAQEAEVAEFREELDEAQIEIVEPVAVVASDALLTKTEQDVLVAQRQAQATGEPVEINGCRIMPDGSVIPRHVPVTAKRIPFTEGELQVMNVLKRAGRPMTTRQVQALLPSRKVSSVSANLSRIFQDQRGLQRGPHVTWSIQNWALRAVWEQNHYPSNSWGDHQKGSTT